MQKVSKKSDSDNTLNKLLIQFFRLLNSPTNSIHSDAIYGIHFDRAITSPEDYQIESNCIKQHNCFLFKAIK